MTYGWLTTSDSLMSEIFSNVLECGNSTLGSEESNIFLIPLEEKKKRSLQEMLP